MSIAGAEVGEEQHRPEVREEDAAAAAAAGQIHLVPRSEKEAPARIRPASMAPVRLFLGLGS